MDCGIEFYLWINVVEFLSYMLLGTKPWIDIDGAEIWMSNTLRYVDQNMNNKYIKIEY
jgi:hypothetical protein